MAMIFYLPLYLQAVAGLSPTQAGLALIPGIVGSVAGSVAGGIAMQRTGKYYWLTLCAYALLLLGQVGILLFSGALATSMPGIVLSLAVSGVGGGVAVTTTLIALIACADPADQAIVTACSYLFRSLGSAVGVSLAAAVVQQRLRGELARRLGDGEETERIVRGVRESLEFLEGLGPAVREVVRACYGAAVRAALALGVVVLVGAVVSGVFVRERKLSR